ncbi:MAG TPA: thiamine pyrophosphate-binding protein [Burkholderiales bacterium]|nr:thiamine pyrophosphate-binding protein [Burkholderiales bacterium]
MNSKSFPVRTGAQILVDALKIHGARMAFGVPGESFLAVLDALHDAKNQIPFINCRNEGGAANMAEAYGKLTGEPGILFVTRGPGASNAMIGLHTAQQDSTPMIMFIGQVGTDFMDREAFQEVEYRRVYGSMTKWVAQIDRADRMAEYVSRAYHTAVSGRPGPVVLALPEDMLRQTAAVPDAQRYKRVAAHPGPADMRKLRELLEHAQRPLVILGGSGWSEQACADVRAFAEANDLPVATAFRRANLYDNRLPNYVGDVGIGVNPALATRVKNSDLLLVVGARMGEMASSGYTLLDVPRPKQRLVHVLAGAEELGRVYQGELLINSGMPEFAAALRALPGVQRKPWLEWKDGARADYEKWLVPGPAPGDVDMGAVMVHLRKRLPANSIVTNGAGNFSGWVHRYYQYTGLPTELAPISGAMGYGVPAAVAAKLVHRDRVVVNIAGDGDFQMNCQELGTATQYGAAVIYIVVNNGMYGTIRMHQEREYPERVSGTTLTSPDFPALARAYGLHGELVTATKDFEAALERALASPTGALIELRVDPDAITTRTTLSAIRAEALQRKSK